MTNYNTFNTIIASGENSNEGSYMLSYDARQRRSFVREQRLLANKEKKLTEPPDDSGKYENPFKVAVEVANLGDSPV